MSIFTRLIMALIIVSSSFMVAASDITKQMEDKIVQLRNIGAMFFTDDNGYLRYSLNASVATSSEKPKYLFIQLENGTKVYILSDGKLCIAGKTMGLESINKRLLTEQLGIYESFIARVDEPVEFTAREFYSKRPIFLPIREVLERANAKEEHFEIIHTDEEVVTPLPPRKKPKAPSIKIDSVVSPTIRPHLPKTNPQDYQRLTVPSDLKKEPVDKATDHYLEMMRNRVTGPKNRQRPSHRTR